MAKRTSAIEQSGPLAAMMEQLGSPPVAVLDQPPPPAQSPTAILIELPIGPEDVERRQFGAHIELHLSPEQSAVLYALQNRLDGQQARLKNDKRVYNLHAALRWLLEAISDEVLPKLSKNP